MTDGERGRTVPVGPPGLTLRPATSGDLELLWSIHREAMRPIVESAWGWDEDDQLSRFRQSTDIAAHHLIEVDSAPVGLLALRNSDDEFEIDRIEIRPAFQGRGIGTAVLESVIARAQATARAIRLQVLVGSPASRLYERLGFRAVEHSASHVTMVRTPR
jgi:ribosomal protein S18 acetylase RimI-like enzyme